MTRHILLLLSLVSFSSVAQNVDCTKMANWFFGRGMTNSGAVNGQVMQMQFSCPSGNLSFISQTASGINYGHEGTGVINDVITGNWQLFSDGNNIVYPVLPPYTGLGGQPSCTQSVAICPIQFCSADSFYVFSNPTGLGSTPGVIAYSMINLSGNVSTQTTLPIPPSTQINSASGLVHGEGMLAIANSSTPGNYWLITRLLKNNGSQSTDAIVVYEVNSSGVSIHQVFDANLDANGNISNSLFGTDGTNFLYNDDRSEIAVADANPLKSVFTYSFDNGTGLLSGSPSNIQAASPSGAYDVEYSPNGLYLYYSNYGGASVSAVNLSTGVSTTVFTSTTGGNRRAWGLGIAPDGNIYANVSSTSNWTVFNSQIWQITNPDNPTTVSSPYQSYSNFLLGNMPNFVELSEFDISLSTDSLCVGDSTQITITTDLTALSIDSIQWYQNGSPLNGPSDSTVWVYSGGTYYADVILTGGCIYTTNEVMVSEKNDLSIDLTSYTCDSSALTIEVEVCNLSSSTLNLTVPLTLYDNNPTTSSSSILYSNQLNINNQPFACDTFSISIPNYIGSIYAVLNDNGTVTTPYSLGGFPYGGINECDYSNNLDDTLIVCCIGDLVTDDTTLCEGTPVNLISSSAFGGNYHWSTNSSFSDTLSQTASYTPTITTGSTTYYVKEYDSTCTILDSITVNYSSLPIINAGNDITACAGDSIVLTAYNPDSALLNWNNGVTDGVGFIGSTSSSYIVQGTLNGCIATDTVSTFINPLPIFTIPNDTIICSGEMFTLSVNGSTSSSISITPNVQNGVAFTPPIGVNEYIVSVQDNGCTGIDTVQVSVNPYPTIQVPSDTTICEGSSLTLNASATPPSSTLTWSGNISNGTPFTPTSGDSNYSVTANNQGCIDSAQVLVSTVPAPILNITSIPPSPCYPDSGSILIEGTGAHPLTFYVNSQSIPQVITGLSSGTYEIEVVDSLGCSTSQSVTFPTVDSPTASFTINPDGTLNFGDEVLITNLTTGSINYWWEITGEDYNYSSQDSVLSFVFPSFEGVYSVCLIVQFDVDCYDTICNTVNVLEELLLYVPNAFTPGDGVVNNVFYPVFSNPGLLETYQIEIYNRWGELIWISNDPIAGWDGTYDGKKVQDGIYTWKISYTDNRSESKSIVGHITVIK